MNQPPFPNRRAAAGLQIFLLLIIIAGYGLMATVSDLRPAVPEMLTISAAITICICVAGFLGERGALNFPPGIIVLIAIAARLFFLFHEPQLSDDIYRYLFDGGQLLSGQNPYAAAPADVLLEDSDAAMLAAKVNHPHLTTLYPPGAQLLFAIGVFLGGITGFKLMLITMDIALIALMMRIASVMKTPLQWVILYAWHPLPVLEIAASGHIDGAGMTLLFAAIALLLPGCKPPRQTALPQYFVSSQSVVRIYPVIRGLIGGLVFALAILVKLFPIVYLPLLYRLGNGRQRFFFCVGAAAGTILLVFSFYPDICNALTTLGLYAANWEFSGLVFRTLQRSGISGLTARIILSTAFFVFLFYCYRATGFPKAGFLIGFAFLATTPTLHPWYGLYMVTFLPFLPNVAGIILSWSITLGYRVLIPFFILNQWVDSGFVPLMIWSGPVFALGCHYVYQRRTIDSSRKRSSR
jgi:hypothetical protein